MSDFKKINQSLICAYQDKLNHDINFKTSQNALTNNHILDVVYNKNQEFKLKENFSNNTKMESTKITDQKNSGRCWIFATLNMIRDAFVKEYNLENFEFSQSYLAFYDKLEKSNWFLNKVIDFKNEPLDNIDLATILTNPVSDGGYFDMAKNLIAKYGIVPSYEMIDSFAAKNTNFLNKILDLKLKQAAKLIRSEKNLENCYVIKETCLSEIYKILVVTYGKPPEKFDIEISDKDKKSKVTKWNNITPQQFLKKINFNLDDYVTIVFTPFKKIMKNQIYEIEHTDFVAEKGNLNFLSVDKTTFNLMVLSMLLNEKSLWFACDVDHFFSKKKGIWDDKLYDFENFFDILFSDDISSLIEYRFVNSNHAMTLQGFDIDKENWKKFKKKFFEKNKKLNLDDFDKIIENFPIKKWNVENSWGDKDGNKGMYTISNSWFDKFVYEAIISKDNLKKFFNKPEFISTKEYELFHKNKKEKVNYYLNKYLNQGLSTKPIKLSLQDPFNKFKGSK